MPNQEQNQAPEQLPALQPRDDRDLGKVKVRRTMVMPLITKKNTDPKEFTYIREDM
jgi:hypothetical protein